MLFTTPCSTLSLELFKPQSGRAIETLANIDRIPNRYFLGIDLVSPYFKISKRGLTVNRRERAVDSIQTMPHLHATNSRAIVSWIEGTPFVTQIGFEIGVKIHRSSRIFESDIRQMTGNITSRDI